jgi:hypothetical protein
MMLHLLGPGEAGRGGRDDPLGGQLLLGDDGAKGEHDDEQHELLHPDLLGGLR